MFPVDTHIGLGLMFQVSMKQTKECVKYYRMLSHIFERPCTSIEKRNISM